MYETEANHKTVSDRAIPRDVVRKFCELTGVGLERTTLPWSEHCTECVWPSCYSTCDLYSPREDLKCRRFVQGMVRVECPEAANSYLLEIQFKRWGKLFSPGNVRLHSIREAERLERRDYIIGAVLYQIPLPSVIKRAATSKRYSLKKKLASRPVHVDRLPSSFLIECYNPQPYSINLSLTMRSADEEARVPFQKLIELTPGFHRVRVAVSEIRKILNIRKPFNIELIPNDVEDGTTLYFGLMEFVREMEQVAGESKKVKCIVWDLDNTIWDGVLVEDGPHHLKLKTQIPEIIRELDSRGVLHSIASKNDRDEAMQTLKHFGLDEYFVFPQISWGQKSEGIQRIARHLNIGKSALLFIDDSQFELEEVRAVCPGVQVLNALQYRTLLEMEDFQAPVTSESKERRKMYQVEMERQIFGEGFGNDYTAFLRHCQIQLKIGPMTLDNIERVHELTQRTNQMNFSGNRYDRHVLEEILATPYLSTYVVTCEDLFGSYGMVGFSIIDVREPRMTDLMFSCRVQSKRIEHAFLGHIIRKHIGASGKDFFANYRKTSRNAPAGRVFADLGMDEVGESDGVKSLVFRKDKQLIDEGIIEILLEEAFFQSI